MPYTLAYMITRFLLAIVAVWVRREVSKDAGLLALRHENAVLLQKVMRRHDPLTRARSS